MGMSASQMRYCMLTGNQSDVQFQGQQVNQQRTTLSTQSAALNTEMLDLRVPTPPSSDQFTKTTYTMTANGQTYTVAAAQYQTTGPNAGSYRVILTNDITTSQGKVSGFQNFSQTGTAPNIVYHTATNSPLSQIITDPLDPNYSATDIMNITQICIDANIPLVNGQPPQFYKYESNGVTKYILGTQLAANASSTDPAKAPIPVYYVDENATEKQTTYMDPATVTFNDSNRMTSITYNGQTYTLDVTTSNDVEGYDDAMNEYGFQKAQYEHTMDSINAKLSVIEAEDRTLELKLKNLDTKNTAIQTELEAVKKVIDKNIEQTFKAFA